MKNRMAAIEAQPGPWKRFVNQHIEERKIDAHEDDDMPADKEDNRESDSKMRRGPDD